MPLASTPDNETIAVLFTLLIPISKLLMFTATTLIAHYARGLHTNLPKAQKYLNLNKEQYIALNIFYLVIIVTATFSSICFACSFLYP